MALCLVTGASGFLGSHLVEALVAGGHQVRALVRKTSRLEWLLDTKVEYLFGDIGDKAGLKKVLVDYEYIFHAAGLITAKNPEQFFEANEKGTRNLLETAVENRLPLKRFVYISSLAASGPSLDGSPVRETDPCHPISIYGESKLAGERAIFEFADRFPVTALRPPAIYGPRDRQLLNLFKITKLGVMPILGEGDNRFTVIYIQDLVRGIIQASFSPQGAGQTYFLTDGEVYSWLSAGEILSQIQKKKFRPFAIPKSLLMLVATLADLIAGITGKGFYLTRRKVKELDYKIWVCDIEKAKSQLGYRPIFDFRRGAEETIKWYREKKWI
ncbi:MAG: NAD-dependent epimerase/dehydratase family protein [candidate division Zixibacteria bacterium]|nr:NAD-dependent epimerase/dehydratase family protein [candidate division Zixibacteria bacterium]